MSEIVTKAAEAGNTELADAVAEEYRQLGEQLATIRREKDALMTKRDPVYREQKQKAFYKQMAPDEMVAAHGPWVPPGPTKQGEVRKKLPSPDEPQPEEDRSDETPAEAPTEAAVEAPQKKKFRVELPRPIEMGGLQN